MKLLETYILRRIFQMFLVALVPVLTIIWTIQVLGRINLVTDTGQSMGSFMVLASLILPTILPVVLPFALVIGITQTLTAMNNDSELPVIDAAGASRSIIYRPVILISVLLGMFSFAVTNFVEPESRLGVRQLAAAAYADLLSSVIEEKTFRSIEPGLYVQISERHSGRLLKGLVVVDYRDPTSDLIYYAKEGLVDPGGTSLTMRDGEVDRKTQDGRISVVKFDSYAFDLSAMTKSDDGGPPLYAADRPLSFLLDPDTDDAIVKRSPGSFRSELHRRLTDWLYPIAFAFVSLVIAGSSRSHRQARVHPMIWALVIAFALRWAGFSVTNLSERSASYVPFVYAVPLGTSAVAIYMLATHRQLHIPRFVTQGFNRLGSLLRRRLTRSQKSGENAA
ncbi:LptF/LptG family permease [Neorhizobium sp. NCHU2750]|uniref:LptF/LptG family permease n=1 Tax=Neorhizobium sp. NCHU2750 TaxID=1825976 RepID=UPI000E748003|nr:lipopolysaccharide export system permease protein [Neorhizobium sp. NCHU2750]